MLGVFFALYVLAAAVDLDVLSRNIACHVGGEEADQIGIFAVGSCSFQVRHLVWDIGVYVLVD